MATFAYSTTNTSASGNIYYPANINVNGISINTGIISEERKPMSNSEGVVEDNYPQKLKLRAIQTIDGWVGQVLVGKEVVYQTKKPRKDKYNPKTGMTSEGSNKALTDVRKRQLTSAKKRWNE